MKTAARTLIAAAFTGLMAVSLTGCGKTADKAADTGVTGPLAAADVEKWSDAVFGKILADHRVSALAIAVTQNDKLIFTKGYGYADWNGKKPVDPATTQFRIASLTKTFVGTAIAQLLERGQIASLDDPVNKYLKRFQIKNNTGKDVTIWDMMAHRGGLGVGQVTDKDEETNPARPTPPLPGDYIAARIPEVVREPGTLSIYCNSCTATLGFMIEDITGMTLQDYMKQNVYTPLGMEHTEITNAPKPGPDVVTQYAFTPDAPPTALPYPVIAPALSYAGDTNSTAADMSKWLIAHITEDPKLMKHETYQLMHTRHAGNVPEESGFGMQFFAYDYNGEHVLEHYGSLQFRSMEFFMLDRKIGVFVTFGGGGPLNPRETPAATEATLAAEPGPVEPAMSHSGVRALVLEHFLGKLPVKRDMKVDVAKYVGTYHSIPANPNDKPGGGPMKVEAAGTNGLTIAGVGPYLPSGPDEFTLDGPLPLQAGFRDSNKFKFTTEPSGVMRMWEHINAGGLEKDAP